MGDVTIREAQPADAAALSRLAEVLGYDLVPENAAVRIETFQASPRDRILVAQRDDRVVGFCVVSTVPLFIERGSLARLTALIVDEDARQGGTGRALVEAAEQFATEQGCTVIQVSSGRRPERRAAHRVYPTLGYSDTSNHHVLYAKRLA